jgi:hypothetical protein
MSNKPDFFVHGEKVLGPRNTILVRIGAAWRHEKGNGVGVQIDALPLDFNGRIVLLEPKHFLIVEDLDDDATDIRFILCERFPRGLELPS